MLERWREEQKRQDLRFGVLAAALTGTEKNPRKASDFFTSLKVPTTALDPEAQVNLTAQMLGYTGEPLKHKKADT